MVRAIPPLRTSSLGDCSHGGDWFAAGYFIEAVRESTQLFGQAPPPFVAALLERRVGVTR